MRRGKWPPLHLLGSWPVAFVQDPAGGIRANSRHTWLTSNGLLRSCSNKVMMVMGHRDATAISDSAFCLLFLTLDLSVLRELLATLTN